jgi:lipopolysaccharide heptosyltransferase I
MSQQLRNILIIKPSALGDIALALPALCALRESFPEAEISWLVRPEFGPLLEDHPYLERLILFDRKKLGRAWRSLDALRALQGLLQELAHHRFDAVFDFQGLFRTAILARATRCGARYGMAKARERATLFYTHRIEQDRDKLHLVDYYLKIAQAAGARVTAPRFLLPTVPEATESINQCLADHPIESQAYVVLVAGSAHGDKCWPAPHYTELIERMHARFSLPVIAVGSSAERPGIQQIVDSSKAPVLNLAGHTNLKELVALLRRARLVISNDTGPGHLGAALGVPLVMMFSWSNPARIYPYGRPECMVAIDPFTRGKQIKSRNPLHNIRNISVDQVFEKVCEQLQSTDPQ